MDMNKLFQCCKTGDLRKIKYLCEHKDIDLNIKDNFDSTPLYYACLCGHLDIVEFLLQNGAKCEMNTFQGERCLYGALNTSIRNLLRNYKIVTSNCMRRDPYQEFLRKVWENQICTDITLSIFKRELLKQNKRDLSNENLESEIIDNDIKNKEADTFIKSHKCILAARSWYFHNLFLKNTKVSKLSNVNGSLEYLDLKMASPQCLESVLRYMYTVCRSNLTFDAIPGEMSIELKDVDDMLDITSTLHLDHLHKQLLCKKMLFSYQLDPCDSDSFESSAKRRTDSTSSTSDRTTRKRKYKRVPSSQPLVVAIDDESEIELLKMDMATLLRLKQDKQAAPLVLGFFVGRSEYFRALLEDPFSEKLDSTTVPPRGVPDNQNGGEGGNRATGNNRGVIPTFKLGHVAPRVFSHVVRYLYQDWSDIEIDIVFDVLQAADEFLLPGLKKVCAAVIASNLDTDNVVSVLLASRTYGLTNLEDTCADFISNHLSHVIPRSDFREVVKSDAAQVVDRQETDTISIIDDVRYYVTSYVQTFEAMRVARDKLELLDHLLLELGLEA